VERIKRVMPHACIGVDVIVGFPAENAERFENTYAFLHALPVSYFHVFTYSERANTTAVDQLNRMGGGVVPKAERSARNRRLRILSEKKRTAFYRTHLGETRHVLWEEHNRNGRMHGFSDNYVKVSKPYDPLDVGKIESMQLATFGEDGTVHAEETAFVSLL